MSIAVKDVLERILVQAAGAELAAPAVVVHAGSALRRGERNAALGVVAAQSRCAASFPSALHFWGMGLRAFAEARGRASDSLEVGERCLCRSVAPELRDPTIEALLDLARSPVSLDLPDRVVGVYEMFADGNRRSVLVETQGSYAALYWENDSAARASPPLLQQLRVLAERDGIVESEEPLIAIQHDADLRDPADATYAWRLGDCAALLFAMVPGRREIEIKRRLPGVATPVRRFIVRGEGASITLVEARRASPSEADRRN